MALCQFCDIFSCIGVQKANSIAKKGSSPRGLNVMHEVTFSQCIYPDTEKSTLVSCYVAPSSEKRTLFPYTACSANKPYVLI